MSSLMLNEQTHDLCYQAVGYVQPALHRRLAAE